MKKLLSIFALVIACVLMFAACAQPAPSATAEKPAEQAQPASEPAAQPEAAPAETAEKTMYTIIDAPKMVGIAWWDRAKEGDTKFAADTGHSVFQLGPTQPDSALQVGVLQDIVAQKPDIINVCPISPDACEPILEQAREQGIIVISHEAPGLKNVDYDIEAFNNAEYGAHLMDKLAELMGSKGEFVIMVGGLTMEAHMQRANGAIERWKEKYPDMVMVTDIVEGQGQDKSYSKMKELLTTYPDLAGVLGFDAVNVPACALAVEEAGKIGKVQVIGTSLVSMCKPYLESGSCSLINFWDPYEVARVMSTVGVIVKEGGTVSTGDNLGVPGYEDVTVDGTIIYGKAWIDVTKGNINDYSF